MKRSVIIHICFALAAVVILALVTVRLKGWFRIVDLGEISGSESGVADYECHDSIMPLTDEEYNLIRQNEEVILVFGNDPFSVDCGENGSLSAMVEEASGAKVINCAITGSCIGMQEPAFDITKSPMNLFSLYYLACIACMDADYNPQLSQAKDALGDAFPENGEMVMKMLGDLDISDVDVIVLCYDGSDYLMNIPTGLDEKEYSDPFCSYLGSFSASVELFKKVAPGARIIILSAPYMFRVTDEGEWEPCEDHPNLLGEDLSDYVLGQYKLCTEAYDISFVDNYYSSVNMENGREYLTDGRILNEAGKQVICDRFMYALTYYDAENAGKVN
jgi:hypothetical protein